MEKTLKEIWTTGKGRWCDFRELEAPDDGEEGVKRDHCIREFTRVTGSGDISTLNLAWIFD
jgi:hypothetical protein